MQIEIPKVVVPVPMRGYHEALEGKFLHVWVNPPMAKLDEYQALVTAMQARELESAKATLFPEADKDLPEASPMKQAFERAVEWVRVKTGRKSETYNRDLLAWYIEVWNQGPAETRWSMDEIRQIEQADPAFLAWMISQTWQARTAHIEQKKKV